MSFVLQHLSNNLWSGRLDLFPEDRLIHGFSARHGGVSAPPYDTLNMALHVDDDPRAVRENRKRYCAALGLSAAQLCTLRQVHGTEIVRVFRRDAGRGAKDYADCIADADAMVTNDSGVALMLCYADCVPVLLYDPVHHAMGLIHAGWRGTVGRIGMKTLAHMGEEFGTRPADVLSGIGPSICADCYVVGEDAAAQFRSAFSDDADKIVLNRGGEQHLDLWEANRIQLEEAGVPPQQIDCAGTCTSCDHTWFYSYRAAGGRTGRMAAVMELS